MMVKNLIIYVLLLPAMLAAQKTFEFPYPIEKMTRVDDSFYIDEVIDVRNAMSDNYIGRVQTGAFNAKNEAFLENSLATELTTVVRQLVRTDKSSPNALILKVNRLKVWEQTFMGVEEAYAFADFQLILKKDTTYYLVDSYNNRITKRSGWDVTGSHVKNIIIAVKSALDTFQTHQNWLHPTTGFPTLSLDEVQKKNTPSILVDSVKKKGVYHHFGEFLNNKPAKPMAYKQQDGRKTAFTIDEVGHKKQLDSSFDGWGFCDGTDIFVYQLGAFFPLQFEKEAIIFQGYDPQKQAKRQQTGAILFGVVGAAIASVSRGDLESMKINMDSGECQPQNK